MKARPGWSPADAQALLRRGFSEGARTAAFAELEELEDDYPAWEASVTDDGHFRAVYIPTRDRPRPAYDGTTPRELRQKIDRHYATVTLIHPRLPHRPEGNTL